MTADWPLVRLEELLQHRKQFVTIDDVTTYKRARVQLHAQGIVLRDEVPGALIKTKTQQVCRVGEFLVAEIDAKVGGFGIVPDFLDGAIVSSHYFLFVANQQKLDKRFLDYFIRTPAFRRQVEAQGSTNYAAIRPADVLGYEMPLPPITEQRRIVARIDGLAGQIDEARSLRRKAVKEVDAVVGSYIVQQFESGAGQGWARGTLGDYVIDVRYGTSEKTCDDKTGTPVLRMGNIQNGRLDFSNLKYLHLSHKDQKDLTLTQGDILVNRTNSAELVGKCAVFDVTEKFSFASYLIRLRVDEARADPRFVAAYINSPLGRCYMLTKKRQMTGQANVNATRLKGLPIPLPELEEQRRIVAEIVALQGALGGLKILQAETAVELSSLMDAILDRAFTGHL